MLLVGWLVALGLLTLWFNDWLEEERNPNRHLATIGEVDGEALLTRNRYGQYLATGLINGEAVEFLVDTGASDVSIPVAVAERLALVRGRPALYQTANGSITAWQTRIDRLQLGGVYRENVRGSINPAMTGETVLLGMSFLKHLELIQRGDTLIIRP